MEYVLKYAKSLVVQLWKYFSFTQFIEVFRSFRIPDCPRITKVSMAQATRTCMYSSVTNMPLIIATRIESADIMTPTLSV